MSLDQESEEPLIFIYHFKKFIVMIIFGASMQGRRTGYQALLVALAAKQTLTA